jgi:hypothetical protein
VVSEIHAQDSSDPTGVALVSGKASKEIVRARERKAFAALELRIDGADWSTIAEALGYPTARAALVAVETALERKLTITDKAKLREMAATRLEGLLRSVAPKAKDQTSPEHLAAVGRYREIVADFRKLYGLDAPSEVLVSTPTQREIDDLVGRHVAQQLPDVEEADIVDAELVEESA